ncbi:aldehyde dehydrogenase family protein [Leptobacterium flavescens]|uniref:Aldehyde dehydrogenase family protein n=1 Tax=Leptobacterium flavescens TaxID=472055 RepID=A0A6P0UHJ9_9FLAO|nr:aldehyde dehydrogenase (NADP(+)) [Leptobacterium flavescens]NER12811.1 aldehyde dehydrogenase family protein [Leptobacterium flavescens]
MITGKNYIGNKLSAKGNKTFTTFNPKLNIPNQYELTEATPEEIDEAVALASSAFRVYRNVPGTKRAAFLNAIADEILALGDELLEVYSSESGLPQGRAMGERGRTIGQLRAFADLISDENWREISIDEAIPGREPLPKPDLRKLLIPLGPVVVFGASNFPLAFSTAGGDAASALAAGCPIIVKSHPMHAGTGEMVASAVVKAAEKTGMPEGVFSNLNSSGIEVGVQLVKHPGVKAVGFTGSIRGGRALYDIAASREEPIPVFAEMGSINPVIMMPGAMENRREQLATTYASSITLGTGQFCTNPGLLLCMKNDASDAFIEDLAQKTVAVDAQCMLHPNIKANYDKMRSSISAQEGLEVVAEYETATQENFAASQIAKVSGASFLANKNLHHEVFGPFSMVVQCKDEEELVNIIDQLEGQLTGTLIADEEEYQDLGTIVDTLQQRVGRIIFNGVPTGVEVCASMTHGGPYPASTDSRYTAVGINAIKRWVRPFSFQDFPKELLPEALK